MSERITSTSAELLAIPPFWTNPLIRGMCIVFLTLILWASWAEIEAMVFADGKVIPAGDIQVIQNLEGGIISEILISSGDHVSEGDLLLRIDNTTARAQLGENQQRLLGMEANIARLGAEIESRPLIFSDELIRLAPSTTSQERELFNNRKDELFNALESLTTQVLLQKQELRETQKKITLYSSNIELMEEEVNVSLELVEGGALSRIEFLQLKRQLNQLQAERQSAIIERSAITSRVSQLQQQVGEKRSHFVNEAVAKRNELEVMRNSLKQLMVASKDKAARTEVRAPTKGIINRVLVNTIGGVIQPGMDLIELVPAGENLLIEAKIKPDDIGFLTVGQKAVVRLSAYDFAVYGSLEGSVERIGADTIEDEQGNQFYIIKVRTMTNELTRGNESLPILPGMLAKVDVITGQRTILSYLSKPITRTKQKAFREM